MDTVIPASSAIAARIERLIEQSLGERQFDMWFKGSRFEVQGNQLTVTAPNPYAAQWITSRYQPRLESAAAAEGLQQQIFVVVRGMSESTDPTIMTEHASIDHQEKTASVNKVSPVTMIGHEAKPTKAKRHEERVLDQSKRTKPDVNAWKAQYKHETRQTINSGDLWANTRLSTRHDLDDFVVGPCNELAYCSVTQLVQDESCMIGAVFVHGSTGVGKTHLLQGVCEQFKKTRPDARLLYTSAEHFTNAYIRAVRQRSLDDFREKLRSLDLLVVDDVHFLAGKESTQLEFLHTFDAMDLSGSRVILASDCHPREIQSFSQALVSRFLGGMVTPIDQPDPLTRRRLVHMFARKRGVHIEPAVIDRLVNDEKGSARELEGRLTQLIAMARLRGDQQHEIKLDHVIVNAAMRGSKRAKTNRPTRFKDIMFTVCKRLGVEEQRVKGNGRNAALVLARSLVVHLCREMTTLSYPEIATRLEKKNHSTMINADKRVRNMISGDVSTNMSPNGQLIKVQALVELLRDDLAHCSD